MSTRLNLHASCVVLGEAGILIRGEAASGKSALALRLAAARRAAGGFAALVSDDRTLVEAAHGRLVARPHPAIAGRIERRGLGILSIVHEPAAILRLVLDLQSERGSRLPIDEERETIIAGISLPRLSGRPDDLDKLAEEALSWPG